MARVAKIQGDVIDTVVVVPGVAEYVISTFDSPNLVDGATVQDIRVTPVILGKPQNTTGFTIPNHLLASIKKIKL